ncbi:MAG TPA: alpha/beta hydrolase [Thermoleophilaceae bacterium]|jgi:pimeloyl-ACP methyl ester carboxylesterase
MPEIELAAGTIEYEDTGGDGPVLVFQHGLAMDGSLWRKVVPELSAEHRCVVPTLPVGGHRRPMRPDADLTLHGQGRILADFVASLGAREVTLVASDLAFGQVVAVEWPDRIARLVLISQEAFDNYPPGLPGRTLWLACQVPGGLNALIQQMRIRPLRRLPMAFGQMVKRPIPHEVTDVWFEPLLTNRAIRRDLVKYVRPARKRMMAQTSERLREFDRPALVVWAKEDRVMPREHGRRLAELLPQGRLVEIDDSRTLIPEDQPVELARVIREFVAETPAPAQSSDNGVSEAAGTPSGTVSS